jgi:putative transposase
MPKNQLILHNPTLQTTSRKLPHWQLYGSVYHVIFATYKRLILSEAAREIVFNACLFFHLKRYEIFVMAVMPDHVHLLVQPWAKSQKECWSLSSITHSLKSYTSKQIAKIGQASRPSHIGTVWEDESWDHIIINSQEFEYTWQYIRENPVKAGLSATPEAYAFFWQSSQADNSVSKT